MSFSSVLKSIGKDLSHVGSWINDGLKVAEPILGAVDPPLAAIFTEIENVFSGLGTTISTAGSSGITEATVQGIVTAITTIESLKAVTPKVATTTTTTTAAKAS